MSCYRVSKIRDAARVGVEGILSCIEQRRSSEAIHVSGVKSRVIAAVVNPETVFPEAQLRDGNGMEFKVREIRAAMARTAFTVTIEY